MNEMPSFNLNETALAHVLSALTSKAFVKIGILGEAYNDGGHEIGAADLGAVHEFGRLDGSIPERSFLRKTYHARMEAFKKFVEANKEKIEPLIASGQYEQVLDRFGAWWVAEVQATFGSRGLGEWKPLADSTVARRIKHSDEPLQNTGALEGSIMHAVING